MFGGYWSVGSSRYVSIYFYSSYYYIFVCFPSCIVHFWSRFLFSLIYIDAWEIFLAGFDKKETPSWWWLISFFGRGQSRNQIWLCCSCTCTCFPRSALKYLFSYILLPLLSITFVSFHHQILHLSFRHMDHGIHTHRFIFI